MTAKDATLARIAAMWAQGVITEEIARQIGATKGSVCRMARDARLKGDKRFPARISGLMGRNRMRKAPPPPVKPKVNPDLFHLKPGECKWPVRSEGERGEEHFFCADPQSPGSPYCPKHRDEGSNKLRGAAALTTWVKT
jgi:hypothetical protein